MKIKSLLLITGLFCGINTGGAGAEAISPELQTLLKNVYESARQVQSASLEINKELEAVYIKKGETNETNEKDQIRYAFSFEQPNKFFIRIDGDDFSSVLVSDGKKIDLYNPELEAYIEKEAPKNLTALIDSLKNEPVAAPFLFIFREATVLPNIFSSQPFEESLKEFEKVSLDGTENWNGIECQKIRIETSKQVHTIWVDKNSKPLIRKAAVDFRKGTRERAKEAGDTLIKHEVVVSFKGWDSKEKITPQQFVFIPPADTKKLNSFNDVNEKDKNSLEGQPAKDFTLKKLDGSNFTLSEQKGKNVVILDFWATWCPPCQMSMPKLEKVVEEYKGKDLMLIAVNQQETAKVITPFLQKKGLNPIVVLDEKGDVGTVYQVNNIPQFVIIGKDGIIKKVIVGVPSPFESTFKELIDAALK